MRCAVALLLVMVVLGCKKDPTLAAYERAAAELPAAMAEAESIGILAPRPPTPVAPSTAPTMKSTVVDAVEALRGKLRDRNDFELNSGKRVASRDPRQFEVAVRDFDSVRAEIDTIRKAARLDESGFVRSPSSQNWMGDKAMHAFKDGVKYLCQRSGVSMRRGQFQSAQADLDAALVLSAAPLVCRDSLSQALAANFQTMVIRSAELFLTYGPHDVAEKVGDLARHLSNPFSLEEAFIEQAIDEITVITERELASTNAADSTAAPEVRDLVPKGVPLKTLVKAYLARHLRHWSELVALAKSTKDPRQLKEKLEAHAQAVQVMTDPSYAMVKFYDSAPTYMIEGVQRQEARLTVLRALAGAVAHRNRTGRWPESLSGKPIDPFDGKPLRFKFAGNRALIYSIGDDLKDSAGDKDKDVTVRFPAEGR